MRRTGSRGGGQVRCRILVDGCGVRHGHGVLHRSTPLYELYQARDGFSTFTVTVVFAVYVVGVLTSLLLAGQVSDLIGRKKVLTVALVLELVAAALFLAEPPLPALLIARLVTGLGVGMLTPTATAYLHDLHEAQRRGASTQRFEIVSTAANIGGLGVGPLVSGILAEYLDAPLRLPYLVFGGLLLLGLIAIALAPETVERTSVKPPYKPLRISAGDGNRAGYLAATVAGFASFAVFGMFTSLSPAFVSGTLHHPSHALAGLVVFAVFGAAAAAQPLTGMVTARARTRIGLLAQAAGVGVLAIGMHITNLAAFLLGGIAAGIGAAVSFKSAIGTIADTAQPAKRGEALAGLYLVSFLGMAVPAVGLGVATLYTTAMAAMTFFTGVLIALLAAVGVLARRSLPPLGTPLDRDTARRPEDSHSGASQRSASDPAASANSRRRPVGMTGSNLSRGVPAWYTRSRRG
jgi:MFS family permease